MEDDICCVGYCIDIESNDVIMLLSEIMDFNFKMCCVDENERDNGKRGK